jgi:hypothetical protein
MHSDVVYSVLLSLPSTLFSSGGRAVVAASFRLGGLARGWSGYDVVRIVLGVLLLSAAGLKAHQLATEPVLSTGLLDSRWLLMATVEFELLFGLWLLGNIWPKPTWAAALACFGLFTCVSLYKALSGYATCGCFGRVSVNPWYTATLDLSGGVLAFPLAAKGTRIGDSTAL